MKKLMMLAGAVALAGMMTGCATGGAGSSEDASAAFQKEVSAWQKKRTPVETLKSKIEIKAAGAAVEAVDVIPFGLYKPLAEKADFAFADYRFHPIYRGYVNDVKALEAQGRTKDAARKEVLAKMDPKTRNSVKAYLSKAEKTDWEEINAWCVSMGEKLAEAGAKFANESPAVLNQVSEILQKEGVAGFGAISITKQAKDDLDVIGAQLKDASIALKYYKQIMAEIEADSKVQTEYPLEG